MKLEHFLLRPAALGDILLSRDLWPQSGQRTYFVLISALSATHVEVEILRALLDDDTEDERGAQRVALNEAGRFLARPVLECGDPLRHRNRPALVSAVRPQDWHIDITYSDTAGGAFYGNFIWMDFAPALDLLDLSTAWPAFS
ncbi:MAG: hypothetical protein RIR26_2821 [Pseudomonadota bacterium]|jgi:hypothetical protein